MIEPASANLKEILLSQVEHLIEIGAHSFLQIDQDRYRKQAIRAIRAFKWRPDLAEICLDQVALIDYRLRDEFLVEVLGITSRITNLNRIQTLLIAKVPKRMLVIQAQWGTKYQERDKTVDWFRAHWSDLEQAGVLKEGLFAYLYWGKELLEKCYMEFPGSNTENGEVPVIHLDDDGVVWLFESPGYDSSRRYGCVSRGR